jgi:hypothetical protein
VATAAFETVANSATRGSQLMWTIGRGTVLASVSDDPEIRFVSQSRKTVMRLPRLRFSHTRLFMVMVCSALGCLINRARSTS